LALLVAAPSVAQEATDDTGAVPGVDAPADGTDAVPADDPGGPTTVVDVIEVDGLLDDVLVDFVLRSIDDVEVAARDQEVVGLVLQVNSPGSVVGDARLAELVAAVRDAEVPVSVWIGPSGGATGAAALLGGHAAELGMSPGTSWGLDGVEVPDELLAGVAREVPQRVVSAGEATDLGLVTIAAPTIGDLIVGLPGVETREITLDDGQVRREPLTRVRFAQLPLLDQLMHTVASPAVAYLLLVLGMGLIVFELFTAGVGVAGMVGAVSFVLGAYGLAALPARGWAVALLVLSVVAFAVDVQTGVPRVWTGVGFVLFAGGSLFLYDGVSMSWVTLLVAAVGVALAYLSGMPAMVRTRFSTPTIGREWMLGEEGRAITAVAPDGVVQVRGAPWRAFTNRATPIEELDRIRVVGIEGLVLEVEPEEGGARDYRSREPR
jgi:membrane-bound serine protease (ClpP class)